MTLAQAYKKQFGKVSFPFKIYDSNGKKTYTENSNGSWWKSEYDSKGNMTYFESSNGYWGKSEYDSKGNETYYENSDGYKSGVSAAPVPTCRWAPKSSCNGKVVEIDGKKYKLKEL